MRISFTFLLLSVFFVTKAQEHYTEAGLRLTLQKLFQNGNSGITYVNEDNLVVPLNITSKEDPGPGISGFHNWLWAYNRFLFCTGLEVGTRHARAEITDSFKLSSYNSETLRFIRIDRFTLSVPIEAGFLAFKSRKGKTRIYTSTGIFTDFTLRNKSEGGIPSYPNFTADYCQNKNFNVVPYFKLKFKFDKVCLAYTYSRLSKQFGNANIIFSENSFSLIFNN